MLFCMLACSATPNSQDESILLWADYCEFSLWMGGQGGGGGWHKALVLDCWPLAVPIGLSPLLILTLCGSERVLVVSTEPLDDLSCLTTPGSAVARAVDQVHPDAHSESMLGLPTPALTCARWGVHLQDNFPDRGF